MTPVRLTRAVFGALLLVLLAATSARGDVTSSTNWAGYVAHRSGVRFDRIDGAWRVPSATCTSGATTYSAMWIGLGGYSTTSRALEQTGTETDCRAGGRVVTSAWYEMVPAPSHSLPLTVRPGDLMAASASASAPPPRPGSRPQGPGSRSASPPPIRARTDRRHGPRAPRRRSPTWSTRGAEPAAAPRDRAGGGRRSPRCRSSKRTSGCRSPGARPCRIASPRRP